MNTLQERKLSVSQLNPLQRSSVFVLFCFVYLKLIPVSVHANPESVIKSILCSPFWVTHKLMFFKCLLDHCFSHNALRSPGYCSTLGTHKLHLQHSFPNYACDRALLEFASTAFFLLLRPVCKFPHCCTRVFMPRGSSAGSGMLLYEMPSVYSKVPSDSTTNL